MSDERREDGIELANIKVDNEKNVDKERFGEELVKQIEYDAKNRTKEDIQYGVELDDKVNRGLKAMEEATKASKRPDLEEGSREESDDQER